MTIRAAIIVAALTVAAHADAETLTCSISSRLHRLPRPGWLPLDRMEMAGPNHRAGQRRRAMVDEPLA